MDEDSHKLAHVKYSLTTYLRNLDGDNATIQKVKQCKNMDEIFSVYSNWYYYSFLYHHREQFSNIVHMVSENSKYPMMHSASEPFHFEPDSLASYFSLSIETTENVKENILSKPITDLINNYGSISKTHLQPFVEHCIEDNYNVLFDIVLLCMAAVKNRGSIVERFNRIINKMDTEQLKEFHDKLPKFYSYCKGENRIVMLNYIHNHTKINIETLYSEIERDLAYYSLYCKTINQKLTGGIQDARY